MVYYLAPQETGLVTISLCPGRYNTDAFDTKLYVVEDLSDLTSPVTTTQCNDDHCSYQSQITVRVLTDLFEVEFAFFFFYQQHKAFSINNMWRFAALHP